MASLPEAQSSTFPVCSLAVVCSRYKNSIKVSTSKGEEVRRALCRGAKAQTKEASLNRDFLYSSSGDEQKSIQSRYVKKMSFIPGKNLLAAASSTKIESSFFSAAAAKVDFQRRQVSRLESSSSCCSQRCLKVNSKSRQEELKTSNRKI